MKDFTGKALKVGAEVVFEVKIHRQRRRLHLGTIRDITPKGAYVTYFIDGSTHANTALCRINQMYLI